MTSEGKAAEVVATILQIARRGATRKQIVTESRLPYWDIEEYIELMLSKGLMVCSHRSEIIRPTASGMTFLKICDQMDRLIGEVEVEEETIDRLAAESRKMMNDGLTH